MVQVRVSPGNGQGNEGKFYGLLKKNCEKMALQMIDPDTLFFQRKLLVTGNTELGLQVKNFLDELDTSAFPSVLLCALKKYNDVMQTAP